MKIPRPLQFIFYTLIVLIPAVWMTFNILKQPKISCSVCITFNGREKCRDAEGPDKMECQRTATDNACAFLSSGMTESIKCASTEPSSVKFRGDQP